MPQRLLALSQVNEIVHLLKKHGFDVSNWSNLGLSFGLVKTTLDNIEEEYHNPDRCLVECLSSWLRQVDEVKETGLPTWKLLTSFLRYIDETSAADGIDQEKQPAYYIMRQNRIMLSRGITDAVALAKYLHQRGVLSAETVGNIEMRFSPSGKRNLLLTSVEDVVCSDYRNLQKFGRALDKNGYESLAEVILAEYYKVFTGESDDLDLEEDLSQSKEPPPVPQVAQQTTSQPSTDFGKIMVPKSNSKEFTTMRTKFAHMFYRIQRVLDKNRVTYESLKTFLQTTYCELVTQLSISKNMKDLFGLVQERCSLLNIRFMEDMVDEFELDEAQTHIEVYKESMKEFCLTSSIGMCLRETFQVSVPYTPLRCESATFVMDWNPEECVLEDIRKLIVSTFEKLTHLVRLVVIKEDSPLTFLCTFSLQVAMVLIAKGFERLEMLKQRGCLSLSIGYITLWEKKTREEEVTKLNEEIDGLTTELNVDDKQLLVEREKEVLTLKGTLSEKEDYLKSLHTTINVELREKLIKEFESSEKEKDSMKMNIETINAKIKSRTDEISACEEAKALRDKSNRLREEIFEKKEINTKLLDGFEVMRLKSKDIPIFESIKDASNKPSKAQAVAWHNDGVILHSPSPQQCADVVSRLTNETSHYWISLYSSSPDSTLALVSQIGQTGLNKMKICNTPLNDECMRQICQCIKKNQLNTLLFYNTSLNDKRMTILIEAVNKSPQLERLYFGKEGIGENISLIIKLLTVNVTLKRLTLFDCGITDALIKSLSNSLQDNETLNYIDLSGNSLTADGINNLIDVLMANYNIKELEADDKHRGTFLEHRKYVVIRNRLKFY